MSIRKIIREAIQKDGIIYPKTEDIVMNKNFLDNKAWHMDLSDRKDSEEAQKWLFERGFKWPDDGPYTINRDKVNFQSLWSDNIRNKTFTGSEASSFRIWDLASSFHVTKDDNRDLYAFDFSDIKNFETPDSYAVFDSIYENHIFTEDLNYGGIEFTMKNNVKYKIKEPCYTEKGGNMDGWIVSWINNTPDPHSFVHRSRTMRSCMKTSAITRNFETGEWIPVNLPPADDLFNLTTV